MPSTATVWRVKRLLLPLLACAACTVVNDPFQPRQIEALRPDAGSARPELDAGLAPAPEPEPPRAPEPAADAGASCSGAELTGCELPQLAPPSCSDEQRNQGEADVDCGGPCTAPCGDGLSCTRAEDCASGFCSAAGSCAQPSCADSELNGGETDSDCGGPCPACAVGAGCGVPDDCLTRVCSDGACAAASCNDQVQNQDEVDTDCGGSCDACLPGSRCSQAADCSERVCTAQGCGEGVELCCQPARCNDGERNGNEPITDCGLAPCPLCPLQSPCTNGSQCASGRCAGGNCALPLCLDGQQNGNESDADCGGNDPQCARCRVGQECNTPADCASGSCIAGRCADCDNQQQDGDETDTDCGGRCGPCATGESCEADADCEGGVCEDDRCCGGIQADCTRCAHRLVSNITCATNGPAAQIGCEQFLQCLAENSGQCSRRLAPECSSPGAVCDPALFGGNGSPGIILADMILGTAQCLF